MKAIDGITIRPCLRFPVPMVARASRGPAHVEFPWKNLYLSMKLYGIMKYWSQGACSQGKQHNFFSVYIDKKEWVYFTWVCFSWDEWSRVDIKTWPQPMESAPPMASKCPKHISLCFLEEVLLLVVPLLHHSWCVAKYSNTNARMYV